MKQGNTLKQERINVLVRFGIWFAVCYVVFKTGLVADEIMLISVFPFSVICLLAVFPWKEDESKLTPCERNERSKKKAVREARITKLIDIIHGIVYPISVLCGWVMAFFMVYLTVTDPWSLWGPGLLAMWSGLLSLLQMALVAGAIALIVVCVCFVHHVAHKNRQS